MKNEPAVSNLSAAAQLIELTELRASSGGAPVGPPRNALHGIRTRLEVCIGEVEMSVGELMAARVDEVVALDAAIDDAIELRLNGQVVARGQLVAVDGRFGFRITELPAPLAP